MLKNVFGLSSRGAKNLNISVLSCVLTSLTTFLPFVIIIQVMQTIIKPLSNGTAVDTGRLWVLFGFGLAAAALYIIAYWFEYGKTYGVAYNESTNMRLEIAERMRKLPLSYFNRKDLAEVSNNIMGDCQAAEMVLSHAVPQLIANIITCSLVAAMLIFYDYRMGLAMFAVLPVSFGILFGGRKIQDVLGKKHIKTKLEVTSQMQEYLEGIKVIKAHGLSGDKFKSLDTALKTMMRDAMKFEMTTGIFVTMASLILQAGVGIVIFLGTNLLTGGTLAPIDFLTFAMISIRIYAPLNVILMLLPEILYFLLSIKRLKALKSEPVMEGDSNIELKKTDVEFKNVEFSYGNEKVLKNISATIPQNAITAIVGPSGSGKSTMARLTARFWDTLGGEIFIGGNSIKGIEPERLMSYISFVFQDVVLFNDTVMNNIRIGKKDATEKEVILAAKTAHCDEFITKMPNGYDTIIGENGCTLSGGERQRISIARALLKDAPIVLLDEATSSLDPENETLIQNAISALIQNKTVIVIAHRLKTIAEADKILVLDNGELVEEGNHNSLMKKNGLYARMVKIQAESSGFSIV